MTSRTVQLSLDQQIALFRDPQRHIVLSPHYDDTALSIGASVAQLHDAGREVTDAILFGSAPEPDQPLTPFAEQHHQQWGIPATEAMAARSAEEARAAQILALAVAYLPFHDAIYRADYYLNNDQLFGAIAAAEGDFAEDVAHAAKELAGGESAVPNADTRFYAPIGVGHHVDHQLAMQAGRELAAEGWDVWFYEDLPYALIGDERARRLNELEGLGLKLAPVVEIPIRAGWGRKIEAIMAYPSQLSTVFTGYAGIPANREAIEQALLAYHTAVGQGQAVERFWVLNAGEDQSIAL